VSGQAPRKFKFAPLLTATVLTILFLWLVGQVVEVFLLLFLGILFARVAWALIRPRRVKSNPRIEPTVAKDRL